MKSKRYYIVLTIAVISLGLLLTGGTYAWLGYNGINVNGNNLNASTTCFLIDYSGDFDSGLLFPSKTDKGGLSGSVTLSINNSCNVSATGNIYLNVGASTSNKYFMSNVLQYSLYASDGTTLLGSGPITTTGDKTLNTNPITLTKTPTTYYVYVWLNGANSVVNNSYLNLPFSGYLHASATQIES